MKKNALVLSIVAVIAGLSLVGLAAYGFAGTAARPTGLSEPLASSDPTDPAAGADFASPSALPSLSASAAPKKSPSKKPTPRPTPSRKQIVVVAPPPKPKPQPVPSGTTCPYHEGTDASKAAVGVALTTAANHVFYSAAGALDLKLIKAVAWQESGWQSTIIACDGGIGTMQVMPNTATWMNEKFGTNYDLHTLSGNTMIGSAYLQWLVKYFGDVYFNGNYSLSADDCVSGDPAVPDYKTPCLLNAVIASYNYGFGAVDTDTGIQIPNPQYVSNVRALMRNCPCFAL
jgi:Transglycosylase SLT domain